MTYNSKTLEKLISPSNECIQYFVFLYIITYSVFQFVFEDNFLILTL